MTSLTNVHFDDDVTLFPALASLQPDGKAWRVGVGGIVFRPEKITLGKKLMLGILRRAMRVSREQLETDLFRQRIRGFLIEAARGKRLAVRIGDDIYPLSRRTRRSGMFQEDILLSAERMAWHERAVSPKLTTVSLVASNGNDIGPIGRLHIVPPQGVSVISDIDDTLKETQVYERRSMLVNTFLRDFVPIEGMGDVYRRWKESGVAFHYVSSSPWQLYEPLAQHFSQEELPEGSFHLRAFRLRDHMLRRIFLGRRPVKGFVIRKIMQRFPLRKFVLVGDSGEFDPEIYGALARRFPGQVRSILIRRVPGQRLAAFRWQRAFRKLPTTLWQLFDDPSEIAAMDFGF